MTSKRFSFKNLILTGLLLVLAIVTCFFGNTALVKADSASLLNAKQSAKNQVNQEYELVLNKNYVEYQGDQKDIYKAKGVLDSITVKYYALIDDCAEENLVQAQKDAALSEIAMVNAFIQKGEDLRSYVKTNKIENQYASDRWQNIKEYVISFLSELNIDDIYSNGKLTQDYLDNEIATKYDKAVENIDNVPKLTQETIDQAEKERQIGLMRTELDKYIASNYYNDNSQKEALYTAEVYKINNQAKSNDEIKVIRSNFIGELQGSKTTVEKLRGKIDGGEQVATNDIAKAIKVFLEIQKNEKDWQIPSGRLTQINIDGSLLIELFQKKMNAEIKTAYTWKENEDSVCPYSPLNYKEIERIAYEAETDIKNMSDPDEMQDRVSQAKDDIQQVEKNVNSVSTYDDSGYRITITSSNPYAFAPTAYVVATDYDYYAVKANLNRILKKLDDAGEGKKFVVKYYIDITIYDETENENFPREYKEPTDKDGNYLETYTVEIVLDEKVKDSIGENVRVVYYYDGEVEHYDSDNNVLDEENKRNTRLVENEEGEMVLMFETTHFSPYAVCGTSARGFFKVDGPIYANPWLYIAIILVAIIAIIVIKIILKHCKYKIVFVNNGGTRVNTLKFKKGEAIEMPTAPTKPGYIFGGWFIDKECKTRFVQTIMKRHKIKVYAKWTQLPYEVATIDDYYKALRACLDDYSKVGVGVGFVEEDKIARIIISNDKVLVYFAGDVQKFVDMGYNVVESTTPENADIPVKFVVKNEDDLYKAIECLEMVMDNKGLMEKDGDPEVQEISDEERENGYLFSIKNEKVADSLKDYFELLRVQSKSFALMGDGGTPRDLNGKYIVKAKRYEDEIRLFLPYETIGAENVADQELYKDVPYMYIVKDEESCKKALEIIETSMLSVGMTKYPRNAMLLKSTGDTETAFGYKIRFN